MGVDVEIFSLTAPAAVSSNIIPRKQGILAKGASPAIHKLIAENVSKYRNDATFRQKVDEGPECQGVTPWNNLTGLHAYIANHPFFQNDADMMATFRCMRGLAEDSRKTFEGKKRRT